MNSKIVLDDDFGGLYEFFKFNLCCYNIIKIKNRREDGRTALKFIISKKLFFQKSERLLHFLLYFPPSVHSLPLDSKLSNKA